MHTAASPATGGRSRALSATKGRNQGVPDQHEGDRRAPRRLLGRGLHFRLFPYGLIRRWAREQPDYLISYIHPRDLDAGQPMVPGLPLSRRFKSYVGLKGAERKLRRLLTDFRFVDLEEADRQTDWRRVRTVRL